MSPKAAWRAGCALALAVVVPPFLACGGSHADPPAGVVYFLPPTLPVPVGSSAGALACYRFEGAGDPGLGLELPDGARDDVTVVGTNWSPSPYDPTPPAQDPCIRIIVSARADAVPDTFRVRVSLANADATATQDLPVTVVAP